MTVKSSSLGEIAEKIGAVLSEPELESIKITGINTLADASSAEIGFISDRKFLNDLKGTSAAAVILSPEHEKECPVPTLRCDEPYLAYALSTALFAESVCDFDGKIDPRAHIDPDAQVADTATIEAFAVVEAGASVGENVYIGAGAYLGKRSVIGSDTLIYPNATIYHNVRIGKRGIIHSGAVIGADGFGFAPNDSGWTKIHQLGGVRIGNDVEIGSNTSVDRGAIEDTIIGNNVKIDGNVFIAHNVRIGDGCALASMVGVAGSTTIGKNCILAGKVGTAGHIEICDGVVAMGDANITKTIKEPGQYSSGTPLMKTPLWRRSAVRFSQLDKIAERLTALEKKDS